MQSVKSKIKKEMEKEFDRQTAKYPKLFKAFATEDPSVFSE